jgi:hypothetical protein
MRMSWHARDKWPLSRTTFDVGIDLGEAGSERAARRSGADRYRVG